MLGERIKETRKRSKLTQEEFGKRLNVGKSTVSQWETGINKPDSDILNAICDKFDVTMDYLYGRSDVSSSTEQQEKFMVSLETLKQIRDQIANGEVEDIPTERIPFIVDDLDTEIEIIERKYREENKDDEQK